MSYAAMFNAGGSAPFVKIASHVRVSLPDMPSLLLDITREVNLGSHCIRPVRGVRL